METFPGHRAVRADRYPGIMQHLLLTSDGGRAGGSVSQSQAMEEVVW